MSETTGVTYPEIELGGVTYSVKFTRGLIYKLDKAGINFAPKITREGETYHSQCSFSTIVDTLKLAIDFEGTSEDLAELCFEKRDQILDILVAGWGKVVLPSLQARAVAKAAKRETANQAVQ